MLLILIMSQVNWKQRLVQIFENRSNKDWGIAGVGTFMISAFLIFRYLYLRKAPAAHRIQEIHQVILNALEMAEQSREPLIVQESHLLHWSGLSMNFTLVSKLKEKERDTSELMRNPFLPPFEEGLFLKELGPSHRLLFNKYNIYQQHLIVVTREFEPQSTPLSRQDFKQTILTFKAIRGLFFFNSGPAAGASQTHKHIQIFPNEARSLPIFRSILEYSRELKHKQGRKTSLKDITVIDYQPFNFKHGLVLLQDTDDVSVLKDQLSWAYNQLYKLLIDKEEEGETDRNYNLIGCEHFLMMIPRRKEKAFNELSVNAVGFMGSILFKDKNLLRKYFQEGREGQKILEDITFSKQQSL